MTYPYEILPQIIGIVGVVFIIYKEKTINIKTALFIVMVSFAIVLGLFYLFNTKIALFASVIIFVLFALLSLFKKKHST